MPAERYTRWVLRIETRAGAPIVAGDVRLTPIARSVRLDLGRGALVWSRAIGVSARSAREASGGLPETLVPIRDLIRRLQLALRGGALGGARVVMFSGRRGDTDGAREEVGNG